MIRIFRQYIPKSLLILIAAETVILFGSVYVGMILRFFDLNPTDKLLVGHLWTKALLYTLVMLFAMGGMGLYQRGLRDDFRNVALRLGLAFLLGLLLMVVIVQTLPAMSIGGTTSALAFVSSAVGVIAFRLVMYQFAEHDFFKHRVMVLGAGQLAGQLEQLRRKSDWEGTLLVGYVPGEDEHVVVDKEKLIDKTSTLLDLAVSHSIHEIVVPVGEDRVNFPVNEILDCKMSGIQVTDLASFFEQRTGRIKLDALSASDLIFSEGFIQAVLQSYVHRCFDMLLGIVVLVLASPIMIGAGIAILIDSGLRQPLLYRQVRVGRNGKRFHILKFRSMSVDAEHGGGAQWAAHDDARVTRVGGFLRKTRIDELPQLINVLKGDMSFVGPRPERPEFVEELAEEIPYYHLRHRVNPGITGWAQICYPYGSSAEDAKEKLQYDLYYIKNYSFFLDLMILIQTAQVVLWGKGSR